MGMWNGEKELIVLVRYQFILHQKLKQSVIFFYCLFLIIRSYSFSVTTSNDSFILLFSYCLIKYVIQLTNYSASEIENIFMCFLYRGQLWFMQDLKKVSALWSVHFRVSTLERFFYKGFLRNLSGTKFYVRLREVSTLEDVRFREVLM